MKKELLLYLALLLGSFGVYAQCGNENPTLDGVDPVTGVPYWYYGFGNVLEGSTNTPDGSPFSGHAPNGGAIAINQLIASFPIVVGDEYEFCVDMSADIPATGGWAQIKMEFKDGNSPTSLVLGSCSAGVSGLTWANYCTSCIAPPGTALIQIYAQGSDAGNGGVVPIWADNFCLTNLTSLPIELGSIDAYSSDGVNVIEWTTLTEDNVEFFEIQRSVNGVSDWDIITNVDAVGSSSTEQFYQVEDRSPSSLNYYRIISHDFDGKSETTPVVVVKREELKELIYLFPNPATSSINVNVSLKKATNYSILDIHGRVISDGIFPADQDSYKLEINNLPPGVYLLKTNESIVRFFKQ